MEGRCRSKSPGYTSRNLNGSLEGNTVRRASPTLIEGEAEQEEVNLQ